MLIPAMMLFISCQKEYVDINEPDKRTAITQNDVIVDLILKVVLKDGSHDNIIDGCNHISIQYPYSIRVREEVINIQSQEDLEAFSLKYFLDRNDIVIVYPITVVYSDFTESVLNDANELQALQVRYNSNLNDDDIECLDFVYPVEIDLYDTEFQKHDFVIARSDRGLYNLFSNLNGFIAEINYPVHAELKDGDTLTILNNSSLKYEITNAIGSCEENDKVEFDDEDYPGIYVLTSGVWDIELFVDTTDETSSFKSYHFSFNQDYTMEGFTASETLRGEWEIDISDDMKIIEIELDTDQEPLVWLNDDWEIIELNVNTVVMQAESDSVGFVKQLNFIKTDRLNNR